MQSFRRLTACGDKGGEQRSEHCDNEHNTATPNYFAQPKCWIDASADESHVIGNTCERAVIHTNLSQTKVGSQPYCDACNHTHYTDQCAFQDKDRGNLARLEAHGTQH